MTNMIDLYDAGPDGFYPADAEHEATLRVPVERWQQYVEAIEILNDLTDLLEKDAQRPVYVTPDQEEAIRAIAKRGSWIVVREAKPVVREVSQGSVGVPLDGSVDDAVALPPAPPVPDPPAPAVPHRPRPGACAQRGGLPHTAMRFVITDGWSVYDPGRKRLDGLCQCGERIPDVKCPHQKQVLIGDTPHCQWCSAPIVAQAGFVDNRDAHGKPDASKMVVPVDAENVQVAPGVITSDPRIVAAYRAPGS